MIKSLKAVKLKSSTRWSTCYPDRTVGSRC